METIRIRTIWRLYRSRTSCSLLRLPTRTVTFFSSLNYQTNKYCWRLRLQRWQNQQEMSWCHRLWLSCAPSCTHTAQGKTQNWRTPWQYWRFFWSPCEIQLLLISWFFQFIFLSFRQRSWTWPWQSRKLHQPHMRRQLYRDSFIQELSMFLFNHKWLL